MIRDPERFAAFVEGVRSFVNDRCVPREDEIERRDEVPADLVAEMAALGYFGWSVPEEYGGGGFTTEELALAAFELSQCSPAIRARVGTNTGIGTGPLVAAGTQEQKRSLLPRLASGALTGCFALTEPDAGSDATALQTRAVRDGDGWVVNGHKAFITNAPIAGLFTVFARTDEGRRGSRGISAFLVEREAPGLVVGPPYRKMGQAGSPVGDVTFVDCRVPAGMLLGEAEGSGFRTAMTTLVRQRIHLAALCVGPAIRMLRDGVAYAMQRRQFDQPIADFQLVEGMIADCRTEMAAAQSLVLDAARGHDDGEDVRLNASMAKYFASEMCSRVADRVMQIFGGVGYLAGSSIERFYRDVRLFRIYEGTSQIHQTTIAKLTKADVSGGRML